MAAVESGGAVNGIGQMTVMRVPHGREAVELGGAVDGIGGALRLSHGVLDGGTAGQ